MRGCCLYSPWSAAAEACLSGHPWNISTNHSTNSLDMVVVCRCGRSSRPEIFTERHSALFRTLKPLIALRSAHTVLPVCLGKQLKCLCKIFSKFAAKFHTHTHAHARTRGRTHRHIHTTHRHTPHTHRHTPHTHRHTIHTQIHTTHTYTHTTHTHTTQTHTHTRVLQGVSLSLCH